MFVLSRNKVGNDRLRAIVELKIREVKGQLISISDDKISFRVYFIIPLHVILDSQL